ncbi:MAG: PIN domain-containing protein [Ilumatobacter sp.]|uniref:type II toxin-antitoxin system VapC family toxin n=1 Tax=Ilumatobacter sp. TaxID=1967498 RepID=UPI00260AFBA4|nr:PIN domain-containing protein [Ilumatobacter sp.]MDJ0770488.1 PIN domain-containing protein [Ilumatobacter sp.]
MLIVDTGPLVAAADRSDRHHHACVELLETATGPLVTTAMVVAEVVYLVTRELGAHAEAAFYDAIIDGTLTVEPITRHDWQRVRELVDRYADLPLGGTDASLIAIAERLEVTRVATLDRAHFHVIRPAHCDAFELVP